RPGASGSLDDLLGVEVGLGRRRRSEQHRLVGLVHERQVGVGLGVDCHGAQTHPRGGAENPPRDLPTVGHEQRLEQFDRRPSRRSGSRVRRLTGVGLTIVVLVGAVAVGYALNGTWAGLTTLRLRWRPMVVAAVVAQTGGAALGILGATDPRHGYVIGLALPAMCAAA